MAYRYVRRESETTDQMKNGKIASYTDPIYEYIRDNNYLDAFLNQYQILSHFCIAEIEF